MFSEKDFSKEKSYANINVVLETMFNRKEDEIIEL